MKKVFFICFMTTLTLFGADFINSIGMVFKEMPAGTIGTGNDKTNIKSFYMAETEVTQAQWMQIMNSGMNPSYHVTQNLNLPVEQISWMEIQEFLKRINAKEKTTKYRLPTGNEWSYAALDNTQEYLFPCHSRDKNDRDILDYECLRKSAVLEEGITQPAKSKKSNKFGLYDMIGNVSEMVITCIAPKCIQVSLEHAGASISSQSLYDIIFAEEHLPTEKRSDMGFRLVREK